jgi:hypothetical protein
MIRCECACGVNIAVGWADHFSNLSRVLKEDVSTVKSGLEEIRDGVKALQLGA